MPTGPQLYDQAADLLLSMPTIEEVEANPDLEEQWTQQMVAWADHTTDKIAAYRAVFRAAKARELAFKEEAARFTTVKQRAKRVQDSVAGLALLLLKATEETTGEAAVTCADGSKVELRSRTAPKVTAINVDKLADVYILRTEKVPNKGMIKKVCAEGAIPPGVDYDADHRDEWVHWGP